MFLNSQGEANAPGGGFEQIRNAYQAWSTVIGTTFRFHDAGFTSAQGFAFDGINAVRLVIHWVRSIHHRVAVAH